MADMKAGLPEDHEDLNKVMVKNLKKTVTKEILEQWLIDNCQNDRKLTPTDFKETKIMEKPTNQTNFAFVSFTTTSATDNVIAALYSLPDDARKLDDNTVNLKRAVPQSMMNMESKNWVVSTKKLFLANLPKTASRSKNTQDLEEIIGGAVAPNCPLGKIAEYQVVMDKADGAETDQCRGIAFIKLESLLKEESDKEKDKRPEHLADKLAIQFGNVFTVGGRSVDLKKNSEDGDSNRGGGFRGRGGRGMPRGGRGMRGGGMRGAMRGGMGGGYGAGAYGQGAYGQGAYDPYAAAAAGYGGYAADPYGAAAAYGAYGQMAGGYYQTGY